MLIFVVSKTTSLMLFTDYVFKQPKKLFGTINAKTSKGEKLGYKTLIMYLSPDKQNTQGKNLCAKSTAGCRAACLFTAGRGRFTMTKIARLHKTEYFLRDRQRFMLHAAIEIAEAIQRYGAENLAIRLNGTSDIPFENIPVGNFSSLMAMFPDVQFYDYTKVFSRLNDKLPANYHLTFSRAETTLNHAETALALKLGYNVSAVFNILNETELPETYMGYPVVNGDMHDLTFIHPKNVVVGLKAKGDGRKDTSGFVIRDFK